MVTEVVPLKDFVYLTHDEGDSVGLQFLENYQTAKKPYKITHHIMLNGSIYLPEADLTIMQKILLSDTFGPIFERFMSGYLLSVGLSFKVYHPSLSWSQVDELTTVFDYNEGTQVMHGTI
jgi:hypothetical protein